MKDSSSSGPRKGRSRNYNNKNRKNNNRRHIKQKVPRRAKKKSLIKRILEFFGIGKSKPKKNQSDQIRHKELQKKFQLHQVDFTLVTYPTKQLMKSLKNCSIKPVKL